MASPDTFVVGVDLGGTSIAVGAVSTDGSVRLPVQSQPTDVEQGATAIADKIAALVHGVIDEAQGKHGVARDQFRGIGIGAPGPIDRTRGMVVVAPNLRWNNFPLRDEVAKRTNLDTELDNDANCATLGEWWLGAGRGARHLIGLTIGTGIGGGIVIDGELYHGAADGAGELGHVTIDTQGRLCSCGNYGCLEAYASGTAIAVRAREALAGHDESALLRMTAGDPGKITAQTVYAAAAEGDAIALEVVRDTAKFLGTGVANFLNIFNPDVVVIAGGVTQAGDALFVPLRAEVRRRAFKPAWESVRIVPAELSGTAGVAGAVAMYLRQRQHA